jgi:hypothetical protein
MSPLFLGTRLANLTMHSLRYEFAKRIFQARCNHLFLGAEYVAPELPPLPDFETIDAILGNT